MSDTNIGTRWTALLTMFVLGLLAGCSQTAKSADARAGVASDPASSSGAPLSAEGLAWLRTTIDSGASDLHGPISETTASM